MSSLTIPAITPTTTYRITSIDLLRGLVMIIMALDHTRDMYHVPAMTTDPLAPLTTTPAIFFTRWITHFCAPAFVFLSGLSAYLSSQKKNPAAASWFLFKRGLWLIVVEMVVVSFGITFDYKFGFIIWQVIWAIGCSMIVLALVRRLPNPWTLIIGCILFFGHDLINYVRPPQPGPGTNLTTVFFTAFNNIIFIDQKHLIGDFYAILPWTGIMLIGYGIGHWFRKEYSVEKRKSNLLYCGLFMIALFIILRFINEYGDPAPREHIEGWRSFLSFMNASKYPPSLIYCCMTLGPAFVFLALSENIKGRWSQIVSVYGRVPFFYYILHFYILHTLLIIFFFATGHKSSEIYGSFIGFRPIEFGYPLWIVYIIWLSVVASLYYPCKWFYKYKMSHGQWWLKYL
ncbi:MAG TPA: heparan-alpha-glucosaminide N-acetyltransferase domain-containing protein [Chitinophagaceae bacterium]|nr:heparan-alpha-glucosaminide N-acetyltransferase domain-containing protein [Chitinophagaceae bacterium]